MIMIKTPSPTSQRTAPITLSEAAWLTELSAKTINAAIDRGELPRARVHRKGTVRRQVRTLSYADVVYLALRKQLGKLLSPRAKNELYEEIARLECDGATNMEYGLCAQIEIALAGGVIRIDMKQTNHRLRTRWAALRNAEKRIVSDEDIRGGEPVIRNTRVPVYVIADLIKQGAGLDEVLEDYPSLNASEVTAALVYAEAHPRRGRPKNPPWQ